MPSYFAALALAGIWLGAVSRHSQNSPADDLTVVFLGLLFALAWVPKLGKRLADNRDATTWALITVGFVLLQLADRTGPNPFNIHISSIQDDPYPISAAGLCAIVGAVLGAPAWIKDGGPAKWVAAAAVLVGVLGAVNFWFLAQHFQVGATAILDPSPLPSLYIQLVEYGCLALTCRAATASPAVRTWIWRTLPVALLVVRLGHHVLPKPPEEQQ